MGNIVICDLPGPTIFFHIISQTALFSKTKLLNIICVFWFSLQLLSETFLILRRIWRDIILHIRWSSCTVPLLLSEFNEKLIFSITFEKYSNIKFHENPSSGSRLVPWGRTERQTERQTDRTKLLVAFRNFAKRALIHSACQTVGGVGMAPASPLSQHWWGPYVVKSYSYVIIEISTLFFLILTLFAQNKSMNDRCSVVHICSSVEHAHSFSWRLKKK